MATEVIRVVDPDMGSGYNYDSLSDWEADLGDTTTGNLPSDDMIAVAKCRCTGGTADDGRCAIDGWTCDSTHYIKIWTDPSESYRHSGKWETGNKYRHVMTEDESANIYITENYVQIIGLQLVTTSNVSRTSYCCGIWWCEGVSGIASHNIIKHGSSATNSYGIYSGSGSSGPFYLYNNITYDFITTGSNGIYASNETNQECYIYNNTIKNCTVGVLTGRYDQHDIKNNLVSGCTTAFQGYFRNSYNNATNNASLGVEYSALAESNNHTSHTFSFVGAEDFHLQASDTGAKGLGLNLYNDANLPFQTDIDGQDRGGSGATWDIGADEYMLGTRVRVLVDATGDPASGAYQLEFRRRTYGGSWGDWTKVVPE